MYITRFLISLFKNNKYSRLLNQAYEKDDIIEKLSYALGTQVKKDWVGRLYAVINPNIRDGKYNPEQVLEYTNSGLSNQEWVTKFLMDRLNAIDKFIMAENLFELLTYDLQEIDDKDNYLFIMEPITLPAVFKRFKSASVEFILLLMTGGFLAWFI